jgi:hypothetical protein
VAAKLVDKVGYIEDAYSLARTDAKVPNAMIVRYHREIGSLLDALSMESRAEQKIELQLPGASALPSLTPGRVYYLPPAWLR